MARPSIKTCGNSLLVINSQNRTSASALMRILRLRRGQSEEVNLIALGWNASRYRDWIPAGILAALCATIYLAVRPPLFDNDGYRDHLYGLQPNGFYNFNRILC